MWVTGTEKVCLCHIPPEALLSHSGLFPAELVDCNLKEKWRCAIDLSQTLYFSNLSAPVIKAMCRTDS